MFSRKSGLVPGFTTIDMLFKMKLKLNGTLKLVLGGRDIVCVCARARREVWCVVWVTVNADVYLCALSMCLVRAFVCVCVYVCVCMCIGVYVGVGVCVCSRVCVCVTA